MGVALYLALAALFLFFTSLQGISHYDIGFYLSGYQHFNEDPYASYFLGQWFLTFRIVGYICNTLGIDTFLGIRILRILLLLVMQTIIYLYLRKYIKTKHIITGLAMATLAQYGAYSDINYNDLSIFMLVCAILLYHKGLSSQHPTPQLHSPERGCGWTLSPHRGDKRGAFLASGIIIGINIFTRLVNLSFLTLPFFAILVCLFYGIRTSWWRQLLFFFIGVSLGILIVLGISWADGSFGVLQMTFNDLTNISSDSNDPHNMRAIIRCYLVDVLAEVKMALFIAFVMYGYIIARMQLSKGLIHLAYSILAVIIILIIWHDGLSANATVGFCLAVFLLDLFTKKFPSPERGWGWVLPYTGGTREGLFPLSMFIPLVMPIGSNGTSQFYGQCLCIIALPLAVNAITKGTNQPQQYPSPGRGWGWAISPREGATKYIIAAICIGMTMTNIFRPMMEDGNRIECKYTIDSKATKFLFTNKENADLHNRMIREVKPHVPSGSHLICNFSITMISVLECKPYGVFAEEFSTLQMEERYLYAAYNLSKKGKDLPYLLIDEDQETEGFRHVRSILSSFSKYEEVWRDGSYVLLKPKQLNHQSSMFKVQYGIREAGIV